MSRFQLSGYAEARLFPGAARCRFRLCHRRDDDVVVMTVGDQQDGGRTAPVHAGFYFATYVGRLPEKGAAVVGEIATYTTHAEAWNGHMDMIKEWEGIEI